VRAGGSARRWSRLALLAGLTIACGRDPRPDVVLVILDTVRADHLSPYGYDRETSPRLAELARDAVVYRNAIAPGTWTAPSHASLFTGLMPAAHGVHHGKTAAGQGVYALDPEAPTLTSRLREAGYRTAAFVGNEGFLDPAFGFARDFDRVPAPSPRYQGPLVFPEAEQRLAERLRALGYAR